MHTTKAVFDGTNFKPMQPIPVKEEYVVIITFVEPVAKDAKHETSLQEKLPRTTIKGLLKGKVRMSEDFNAPLEEMKEYK